MPVLNCPICKSKVSYREVDEVPYRPFCSHRCKMVDLGRWLSEEYRISEELPDHLREGADRDAREIHGD
jgi:endogenous inhibitor of DNA gyrase (YacG/DUF329 family)